MTKAEFIPIYKDLVSICGQPHGSDKDLNTRHFNQMFGTLERWDSGIVKRVFNRIRSEFGRTDFEGKWPKPGKLQGICEDLHAGQSRGLFEEPKSDRRQSQEAEMFRIDRAINSLSADDRAALNHEAAIRVLEPIVEKVVELTKGQTAPLRNDGESDRDWAIRLQVWLLEIIERAKLGRIHQGPMGTFTAEFLVLTCREFYEARIIMTMREIAKERGVI
jgi:hypothetical protein